MSVTLFRSFKKIWECFFVALCHPDTEEEVLAYLEGSPRLLLNRLKTALRNLLQMTNRSLHGFSTAAPTMSRRSVDGRDLRKIVPEQLLV